MELLLIVILALIVFGPAKLPEIMGQVGKAVNDFRRATTELSDEFNKTIQTELQETRAVMDEAKSAMTEAKSAMTDAKSAVTEVHSTVNSAVTGAATLPAAALVAEPNGAAANGSAAADATPAMADTSQWSWETAASPEPVASVAEGATPSETAASDEESIPASHGVSPDAPVVPAVEPESEVAAPPTAKPATARDDLAPPY
jgi:TatA/E family protein of Tat protein translocase